MKYLLKYTPKKDEGAQIKIELRHVYREYDRISDIIHFIWDNSIFIEDYKVFEIKEFEHQAEYNRGVGSGTIRVEV